MPHHIHMALYAINPFVITQCPSSSKERQEIYRTILGEERVLEKKQVT
jgi:hypothetical protein